MVYNKNMKSLRVFLTSAVLIVIISSPVILLAQTGGTNTGGSTGGTNAPTSIGYKINIPSPLSFCDSNGTGCTIPTLIGVIIDKVVIPIGGIVAVLMIMYAGFLFVTAQGDTAKIKKARDALLYAAIGAAILLGAKLMATAIQGTVSQLGG